MRTISLLLTTLVFTGCTREEGAAEDSGEAIGTDSGVESVDSGVVDDTDEADTDAVVDDEPAPLGAPYPIVLTHGFAGFTDLGNLDLLDYFYGVPDHMAGEGEPQVYATTVDPFNSSEIRGEQLIPQIEAILAETGHAKVNLIGHSQGGIDARYVASTRPDLVASVTTVSTPHLGSRVADILLGLDEDAAGADLVNWWVEQLGGPLYDAIGNETDFYAALHQLSAEGSDAFNAAYPDDPSVAYYSVAGRSDYHLGGTQCVVDDAPDFVVRYELFTDPIDPLFAGTEELLDGGFFAPEPNDGLVTVTSSQWGTFLGCIPADHTDQIGQIAGDLPGLINPWRHKEFFAELIEYVRDEGF